MASFAYTVCFGFDPVTHSLAQGHKYNVSFRPLTMCPERTICGFYIMANHNLEVSIEKALTF